MKNKNKVIFTVPVLIVVGYYAYGYFNTDFQKDVPAEKNAEVVELDQPPVANMFGGVPMEYVHERVLSNIEQNKAKGMVGYSVIVEWLPWVTKVKMDGQMVDCVIYFPKLVSGAHYEPWEKGEVKPHFYVDYKAPTARILTKPNGVVGTWTKIQVADRVNTSNGARLMPKSGLGLWHGDYHGEAMEYMWALIAPIPKA